MWKRIICSGGIDGKREAKTAHAVRGKRQLFKENAIPSERLAIRFERAHSTIARVGLGAIYTIPVSIFA